MCGCLRPVAVRANQNALGSVQQEQPDGGLFPWQRPGEPGGEATACWVREIERGGACVGERSSLGDEGNEGGEVEMWRGVVNDAIEKYMTPLTHTLLSW